MTTTFLIYAAVTLLVLYVGIYVWVQSQKNRAKKRGEVPRPEIPKDGWGGGTGVQLGRSTRVASNHYSTTKYNKSEPYQYQSYPANENAYYGGSSHHQTHHSDCSQTGHHHHHHCDTSSYSSHSHCDSGGSDCCSSD